jgi:hypothetical protein
MVALFCPQLQQKNGNKQLKPPKLSPQTRYQKGDLSKQTKQSKEQKVFFNNKQTNKQQEEQEEKAHHRPCTRLF